MLTILFNQGFARTISGGGGGGYAPNWADLQRLEKEKQMRRMKRDEKDMLELVALITPNVL